MIPLGIEMDCHLKLNPTFHLFTLVLVAALKMRAASQELFVRQSMEVSL